MLGAAGTVWHGRAAMRISISSWATPMPISAAPWPPFCGRRKPIEAALKLGFQFFHRRRLGFAGFDPFLHIRQAEDHVAIILCGGGPA